MYNRKQTKIWYRYLYRQIQNEMEKQKMENLIGLLRSIKNDILNFKNKIFDINNY